MSTNSGSRAGAIVPIGWGAYNAFFLIIMGGFGGRSFPLGLLIGGIVVIELFGLAVYLVGWRYPLEVRPFRLHGYGGTAAFAVWGFLLGGLGIIFGSWFWYLSGPAFAAAIWMGLKNLRSRHHISH
jgi:hypothetical protein